MVAQHGFPRVIDTERLQLRDPRAGDAEAMFAAYGSRPEVVRYLGWRAQASVADAARQIGHDIHRWLKGSAWVWVMALRTGEGAGRVIGQIELMPMSHPAEQAHHLRLGYMLSPDHWGQGHMQEALEAVVQAAFRRPQVWRVDALCDVDNARSAALLARIGMQREGLLVKMLVHPNVSEVPRDAWVFALTRPQS